MKTVPIQKTSVLLTKAIQAIEYAKTWYEKWPQGLQDGTAANNLINTQFTDGKAAAIIEGPGKQLHIKKLA